MYIVSIASHGIVFNYTFKAYKNADELFKKASKGEGRIDIEDDYGSKGNIDLGNSMVNFTDVEKDADLQGEQQILKHKAMLKAQRVADNDIGLQLLQKNPNSKLINQ